MFIDGVTTVLITVIEMLLDATVFVVTQGMLDIIVNFTMSPLPKLLVL